MNSTFGWPLPALTYELYVGLWLNLERVWNRGAMAALIGTSLAMSDGDLPRELFESMAFIAETATESWWASTKARSLARGKRAAGWE